MKVFAWQTGDKVGILASNPGPHLYWLDLLDPDLGAENGSYEVKNVWDFCIVTYPDPCRSVLRWIRIQDSQNGVKKGGKFRDFKLERALTFCWKPDGFYLSLRVLTQGLCSNLWKKIDLKRAELFLNFILVPVMKIWAQNLDLDRESGSVLT